MNIAVLFDLEDTLIQTPWADPQHVLEFRRGTKQKLIEVGIPSKVLEGIERATLMRNKAAEYIEQNLTKQEARRIYQEMESFLAHYELDSAQKSRLFPETIPTLEQLKSFETQMGLVTNTSIKAVRINFELHGLAKYFDAVVTREDVKKLKPDPQGILVALTRLKTDRFFMVGDLANDASAAKEAKGKSIIVRRNPTAKADFEADYFVQSLAEVPSIILKETANASCQKS
jgi:HAD superfamily hydrolase (TIGR01549 family)